MKLSSITRLVPSVLLAVFAATLLGQSPQNPASGGLGGAPGAGLGRSAGRRQGCAKQLGISQSVIAQHRTLHENALSQVRAVCSDSSLTNEQKKEKIRQIRETTRQQTEALLTPTQQQQLKECEAGRRGGGGAHGGAHAAGMEHENPCAEVESAAPTAPSATKP